MANFSLSLPKVLAHEGGYQAATFDTGNYACGTLVGTNKGISAPVLQAYLGNCPTALQMKSLATDTAAAIYKSNYWDKFKGDTLQSQPIADLLLDFYVNAPAGAIKTLQIALNALGESLNVDGKIGAQTVSAINAQIAKGNEAVLHNQYLRLRRAFYNWRGGNASAISSDVQQAFMAADIASGTLSQFLAGWQNRVNSFTPLVVPVQAPASDLAQGVHRGRYYMFARYAAWFIAAALGAFVITYVAFSLTKTLPQA